MKYLIRFFAVIFVLLSSPLLYSADASVNIISPKDGDKVATKFLVKFGAENIAIVPAGTEQANSGHHHLIIDGDLPDLDKPMGANVKHFGKGQTETELELSPGVHTLQLILGDKNHQPQKPAIISKKITITVIE